MRLFMILYTATGIGGTWGPLPYDMDECERRRDDAMAELREAERKHPEHAHRSASWRMSCEFRAERPKLGALSDPAPANEGEATNGQ